MTDKERAALIFGEFPAIPGIDPDRNKPDLPYDEKAEGRRVPARAWAVDPTWPMAWHEPFMLLDEDDARLAVACVNAMRGIQERVPGTIRRLVEVAVLASTRDEDKTLAALYEVARDLAIDP